jgi:hypothetical protein
VAKGNRTLGVQTRLLHSSSIKSFSFRADASFLRLRVGIWHYQKAIEIMEVGKSSRVGGIHGEAATNKESNAWDFGVFGVCSGPKFDPSE